MFLNLVIMIITVTVITVTVITTTTIIIKIIITAVVMIVIGSSNSNSNNNTFPSASISQFPKTEFLNFSTPSTVCGRQVFFSIFEISALWGYHQ